MAILVFTTKNDLRPAGKLIHVVALLPIVLLATQFEGSVVDIGKVGQKATYVPKEAVITGHYIRSQRRYLVRWVQHTFGGGFGATTNSSIWKSCSDGGVEPQK